VAAFALKRSEMGEALQGLLDWCFRVYFETYWGNQAE
jgi:hypothetical protein